MDEADRILNLDFEKEVCKRPNEKSNLSCYVLTFINIMVSTTLCSHVEGKSYMESGL